MTPEQLAAFQFSMAVSALAKIEGMKAENMQREVRQESMTYVLDDFERVIDEHGLHHNSMVTLFSQ